MKKIIAIGSFIVCLVLLSLVLTAVFIQKNDNAALTQDESLILCRIPVFSDRVEESIDLLADRTTQLEVNPELVDTLRAGILDGAESIDISSFHIPTSDITPIKNAMEYLSYLDADLFFVDAQYALAQIGGYCSAVYPTYLYAGDELTEVRADFEARISSILNSIPDGFSDLEKALFLHDYLISHYEYDETYVNHNPYVMMVSGVGVCQAYTGLYSELLSRCGIDVAYVISLSINHIWNGVKIGDNYYHVDVTFDDAIGKLPGQTFHNFFLVSDDGMMTRTQSHGSGWTSQAEYQNKEYDNAVWTNIKTNIVYLDGYWYGINLNKKLIRLTRDFDTSSQMLTVYSGNWRVFNSTSYYSEPYAGLEIKDDKLWFNTPEKIMSWQPGDASPATVYTYDGNDGYLYGLTQSDGILYYTVATQANRDLIVGTHALVLLSGDTDWQKDFVFLLENNQIILTEYKGNSTTVTIPGYAMIHGAMYQTVLNDVSQRIDGLFYKKKTQVRSVVFEAGVLVPERLNYLFADMTNLTSVDVRALDVSNVRSMSGIFQSCSNLTTLDLSTWNLSALTSDFSNMFLDCEKLIQIRAPLRVNRNISLPSSIFAIYDEEQGNFLDGKYSTLPKGLTESVLLKRDPRTEPSLVTQSISVKYNGKQVSAPTVTTSSDAVPTIRYFEDLALTREIPGPPTHAGTYYYQAHVDSTETYYAKSAVNTIRINQVTLTIRVYSKEKNYGDADPEFTYKVTGLVNGESMEVTVSREAGENADEYGLFPIYEVNPDYKVTEITGKLTIHSVSLAGSEVTLDTTSYPYLKIAYEPGVTVVWNEQTLVRDQDYRVTYSNNVNAGLATVLIEGINNFNGSATKRFTIEKRPLTVEALPASKTAGEADPELTGQITGLIEGDTISVTYERDAGETPGVYQITPVFSTIPNYQITSKRAIFTIYKPDAVSISGAQILLSQDSFVYNGYDQKPVVTVKLGDNTLVENTDYSLSYSDARHAGQVTVTVTGKNDYGDSASATYEITKAPLTVKVASYVLQYGENDPKFYATFEGLLGLDSIQLAFSREEGRHAGTYQITAAAQNTTDYEVTVIPGTLTIQKIRLIVKTDSATKKYDGTPLTASGSATGLVEGDSVVVRTTGSQTEVGHSNNTYELDWTDPLNAGDYEILEFIGVLTVEKAPQQETDKPQETETESETETETEKPKESETDPEDQETKEIETNESESLKEPDTETQENPGTETKPRETEGGTSPKSFIRSLLGCSSVFGQGSAIMLIAVSLLGVWILYRRKKEN